MTRIGWGVFELDPASRLFRRAGVDVDLQPRAFEVLLALAQRLDQAVSRDELLAIAWAGTKVVDNALTQVIRKVRQALGDDPEEPTWLLSVPRFGYRLRGTPVLARTPATDGYVGRTAERERLASEGPGLVAVVGPGGMGKTRLVAEALRGRPALWVDLASADTPASAASFVAHALGLPGPRMVGPALAGRSEVVVLDTVDRVAGELAELVSTWSADAPQALFVATSRVPVVGARSLPLGPLTAEEAATLLALRCGRAVTGDAGLDHLLDSADGLPLALEILGVRARYLSLMDLDRRIRGRSSTVEDPRPDRPLRQRSLGASIEATLALATPATRRLLVSLAVFEASFRPNDADEVVGDGAGWELTTLGGLGLLVFDCARGSHRLLHAVRDWALGEPRPEGLEDRHARWVGHTLDTPATHRLRECMAAASRPVADREVRLALASRLLQLKDHFGVFMRVDSAACLLADQATDPDERASHLVAVMILENYGTGAAAELRRLADGSESLAVQSAADWAEGRMLFLAQRHLEALAAAERAIEQWPDRKLLALNLVIDCLRALGRHEEAVVRARERVALARLRSPVAEAHTLVNLARLGRAVGQRGEVKAQLQSAINLFRSSDLRYHLLDPLNLLGVHASDEGDLTSAEAHWRDALALAVELGDRCHQGHLELNLACLALLENELDSADSLLRKALQASASVNDRENQARVLAAMGSVFRMRGAPEDGISLSSEALAVGARGVACTGVARLTRATCALDLLRFAEARADLTAIANPPVWLELQMGFLWAELLHCEGDPAGARVRFDATCAAAERAGMPVRGASLVLQHGAARKRLGV